jgi:LPPG:FO 2-phospho-L-lactate transferase
MYFFGWHMMITLLAGGVGAARFLKGLVKIVNQSHLSVIVNTGDDIELFGLHISPDIDIVMYTLAGIVDEMKGWGIRNDTFYCLRALEKMDDVWFTLGDSDLATHLFRTSLIRKGLTLSEITTQIRKVLGLQLTILPMTDDKFETRIMTDHGSFHFEEYLVKRGARDDVLSIKYKGAENARPATGVIESILASEMVIICPSNPVASIGTILTVKGVRNALRRTEARKVAISPIISGAPIKGPADKLMQGLGLEVSAYSVARLYSDFIDAFVIDNSDTEEKNRIEALGVEVRVTNTVMNSLNDKIELARFVLQS